MHVEVRRAGGDAIAQHAAPLGIGLGGGELKPGTIELGGNVRQRAVGPQTVDSGDRSCASL